MSLHYGICCPIRKRLLCSIGDGGKENSRAAADQPDRPMAKGPDKPAGLSGPTLFSALS